MKNVVILMEQEAYPSAKVSIKGKKIRMSNGKIVIKECVVSLDKIAESEVEVGMNLEHLRELVDFLQYILDIIDEEDSIKLHVGNE